MSLSLSAGYTINIVTHPPARPSVRSFVRPLHSPSVAGSGAALAFQPSCMHRPYTRPIMYSVRDFVFDKYKSTRSGAQRNPSPCRTNAFREIRKTCGVAMYLETRDAPKSRFNVCKFSVSVLFDSFAKRENSITSHSVFKMCTHIFNTYMKRT